ncbi:MAG: glycine cleavage system protein GcvH [Candidatus Marinimicrobia bacterium]|jgi:glycine cleavage system H protein|nr:glycine cleavage system protein GcvH [Candidatus Neomarinimicrobiota bacterium]MDP7071352.1 glycine cleavage system protein GcvH [Candidatus Neomarinimicrobiota bacterium]
MNIPDELRYTKDHEWVREDGDAAVVGITEHAQGELGDIVFVEFPEAGDNVTKNEPFGTIEAVKTVADLFAPISGEVLEINEAIEDAPELANSDPYGEGWLIKISISNAEELDSLMSASGYKLFIESEG